MADHAGCGRVDVWVGTSNWLVSMIQNDYFCLMQFNTRVILQIFFSVTLIRVILLKWRKLSNSRSYLLNPYLSCVRCYEIISEVVSEATSQHESWAVGKDLEGSSRHSAFNKLVFVIESD